MKILIFSYKFHPDVGGIESISKMLATYFTDAGHEVHLLTKTRSADRNEFPFKVTREPGLATVIRELKWADIAFENNPCFSMSYPNFIMRKPSVIALQTWLESLNGKYDTRQKFKHGLLRSASKVVACSKAIKTTFPDAVVIPNPYNAELFRKNGATKRTKDFIFLGRLVSDKGADMAIMALYKLRDKYHSATLTIVGNGEELIALKQIVNELNIQWPVHFTGILEGDDLVDCLNEHKFLVVPSLWKEPFGIVALEGLACGCIPIVSDGGGLIEAAGEAGLVFERGNTESLLNCMEQALNASYNDAATESAVHQHLSDHTVPVIAEQYLQIFETVLEKHGKNNL